MDWEVRAASLILCLGILLATIQNGIAERRIVCYQTNWSVYRPGTAKFSPQNINPYLCTHLIYAFGGFTKENALKPFDKYQDIEKGGYAKFTGLKTYNKNLKTMLAIGGWNEGSSRFSPMVADSARRREFVKNAVKFLRQNHFDGLDLDWEYPAFRDGGKPRDKDNYANLVQELREEFERESSKTGRPRLLLSMAMPAGVEYIDKGYDVPRLNEHLDFINLLSYDYHSAYEPVVNHHSPLYPLEEDNEYNYDAELTVDYTINYLLEKGASADKIVLGIPTYGRSYTLFNQDATELGSPADGPGVEGDATREKGYLAYFEICENIAGSDEWEVVQPNAKAMGPYAFKGDQWIGYDDENIVKLKARYVNEKKLGGIMFWSIDNDDFRGKCHGRPYPLIEAAKEALLTDNSGDTIDKPKSQIDSQKKTRTQSAQSNASKSNRRRSSTTSTPIATKRASSSRPKYRNARPKANDEDEEESKKSHDSLSDEDIEGRNTVRVTEKTERPKNRNRSKSGSTTDRSSHRNKPRRKEQTRNDENEEQESLSNKLATPEPPTTPDPGTDFKCEDEGFFPHPRDCKKYFWCLDSGPSGLGVVAHQFTCPSGLVFNKAADSCDYPRNVICPKTSKSSIVSTTKSPITAATSRTTYLHSTTTVKAESEEYDSEEDYEDEIDEEDEEEEEAKEEPKTTTTAKPLVYKTLTRNRPSTTTTTTTTTTLMPSEPERALDSEDEEDPKVIKELIDLIKKAGGIEQLEKQLLLQDKNADTTSDNENITPATISRSLYERVLNRQASRIVSQRPVFSSSEIRYVNGPGRAQFEGLDEIPEVKSLRRSQKPQYVTIERSRSPAKVNNENIEEEEEEEEEDDSTDVASSEEESVSHPEDGSTSTHRVTPNYVNIRRTQLSTTTSRTENNVVEKEVEKEKSTRRRRPFIPSKQQDNESSSETSKASRNRGSSSRISGKEDNLGDADQAAGQKNDSSQTTKSRYTNVQRFRSTTFKTSDDSSSVGSLTEVTSESTPSTRLEEYSEVFGTTAGSTDSPTTTTSTEVITVISVEPPDNASSVNNSTNTIGSTTDSVRLVEDSATEILLTTVPATVSSSSSTTTATTLGSRSTIAAVSQPRPFGFTRRRSGNLETTTTAPSSRSKVSIRSRNSTRQPSSSLGRLRTRPVSRIAENESVDAPLTETTTSKNRELGRLRNRGSNRYVSSTSKSKTEETNFVPASRYRERGRTATSTTITPASGEFRRRYRRPSRVVGGTESTKINELEDSPIVRITQGNSRRNPSFRSRSKNSDEENNDKITNIRVFRKPSSVNRDLYDRTKYTKKRNNAIEVPARQANSKLNQRQATSTSTLKDLEANYSAEIGKIEKNDLLNIIEQETTTVDSVVESNTIEPVYIVLKSEFASGRAEDAVATTAHIEAHKFNPNLVTIVSTEHTLVGGASEKLAPRRRKVLLRRRPASSGTAIKQTAVETDETQVLRKRKVIRRPLQDTSSPTLISLEAQVYNSTLGSAASARTIENSTLAIIEKTTSPTTLRNDFVTLETPATVESTTVFGEEALDFITTMSTIDDATSKPDIEASTTQSILAMTRPRITTSLTESGSTVTEAQINVVTSSEQDPLPTLNFDARYTRRKFIRKNPVSSSGNSSSSSTETNNSDVFAKRGNNLFIRPISSTAVNALRDDPHQQEVNEKERKMNVEDGSRDLAEKIEDATFENKQQTTTSSVSDDSAEFWKYYTTVSSRRRTDGEDLRATNLRESDTDQSTSIATHRPETNVRPRYKIPVILRRPFDPEEALSPRPRYHPLDSAPEESEETPETRDARLRQSNGVRQPRTRYKLRERIKGAEGVNEVSTSSPEGSTWQHFRSTRPYSKRPSSTEAAVTETLIPARKFDYVADAFHRKQQSLRTTTPRSSDPSQNLVDPDYATTPKPSVTRLVTSVTESGTTERQIILIKTKYSSLTATTRIPADRFPLPPTLSSFVTATDDDESVNEVRQSVERSTLPIESEFNYQHYAGGRFTTESHESSTIEIESVFNNLITSKGSAK